MILIVFVKAIGVFEKWSDLVMEAKLTRKVVGSLKQLCLGPPQVAFLTSVQGNARSPNFSYNK